MPGSGVRRLVEELSRGVGAGWGVLRASSVGRGRFPEESNLELEACTRLGGCARFASLKAFEGRGAYRAWLEFFNVSAGAPPWAEDLALDLAAAALGPGERLFYEYSWDPVTVYELERGVHPALTRLGYKMLLRGFTWFKDWYFPEGFMEGSQKLQAEKPVAGRAAVHLGEILDAARKLGPRWPEGAAARARALLALAGGDEGL